MTLSADDKKSLSPYRLKKAEQLLEDARLLLENERWSSAVNRSYYAAMSAARAALILFGSDPKSHDAVKAMVGKKLVLEERISKQHGKWFRGLSLEREDVDYGDYVEVDATEAQEAFDNADRFIAKIKEILPSLVQQLGDNP